MKKSLFALAGSVCLMTGCSNMDTTQQRTLSGGAIGATAGAVGAAIFHSNPIWGAVGGAAVVQPLVMSTTCTKKISRQSTTKATKRVSLALSQIPATLTHQAQSKVVLISILPTSALWTGHLLAISRRRSLCSASILPSN